MLYRDIFDIVIMIGIGLCAYAMGYKDGKRTLIGLLWDHIHSGRSAQNTIDYEHDVMLGRVPKV